MVRPILFIHGYSSEEKDKSVTEIYGDLPQLVKTYFPERKLELLNLSRWLSLNDALHLDDVTLAMDRALKQQCPELLSQGFDVIVHSTGALIVRNWLRNYSTKPSPIGKIIYLAGAHFGSGLAHIGRGQLSRWYRRFHGTGVGLRILAELEIGSHRTLDLQHHLMRMSKALRNEYGVYEFCLAGSQTLSSFRYLPIRYLKEDSADNTVRTASANLNSTWIEVKPTEKTEWLSEAQLKRLIDQPGAIEGLYQQQTMRNHQSIPYSILFETAHFGEEIGIVMGTENRNEVMGQIADALRTPETPLGYQACVERFEKHTALTFARVAKLKSNLLEWDKQAQYEGHSQLIFRLRDQFGRPIEHFDINFQSEPERDGRLSFGRMIEDKHSNKKEGGTITFYLRTQKFKDNQWVDRLEQVMPVAIEVTAIEPDTGVVAYVPLCLKLDPKAIRETVRVFETTVFDLTLSRLPSNQVFSIFDTEGSVLPAEGTGEIN